MTRQTRIPTVPELRAHARDLAAAFHIRLVEDPTAKPEEAFALPSHRIVRVAPIIDETTYAVALHELGHLCAPAGFIGSTSSAGRSLSLAQHEESAAWEWAEHYALQWTAPMAAVAAWCQSTYDNARPKAITPKVAPRRINWDEWK